MRLPCSSRTSENNCLVHSVNILRFSYFDILIVRNTVYFVAFVVLTAVIMNVVILGDIMPTFRRNVSLGRIMPSHLLHADFLPG
jgi:hypothetical protein